MSLAPLALSFALLLFWTGLGWSLIAIIEPSLKASDAFLIAPVCGLAATLMPVFWLSALGFPVASFARPLGIVLGCCVVGIWLWRRPHWTRGDWILAVPVVVAIVMFGFPSLRFGFDWVANANDDWANYNLSAMRLLDGGLFHRPAIADLRAGLYYPGYFWFLEVAADTRPGADLLLAWTAAIAGRNPFFVYMPLIMALHGAFSLAAAAVASRSLERGPALFAGLALSALAPLSLYAVHQQLLAQVLGLAFMCGLSSLAFVPLHLLTTPRRLALTTAVTAAYAVAYPETVPFFGLAFLIYHAGHVRDREWGLSRAWRLGAVLLGVAVLLGPYVVSFVYYLHNQFQGSSAQGVLNGVSLFPYFLVPSGLATLFGLLQIADQQSGLGLSLDIAAALVLCVLALVGTVLFLRRRAPLGCYLAVILVVAVMLVRQRNDFGLFKLAMFVQPFLWFILVAVLLQVGRRWGWIPIVMLGCALLATDIRYTNTALDERAGGASPIPGASGSRLLSVLLDGDAGGCNIDIGTALPPLAKILAAKEGCGRTFLAREMPQLSLGTSAVARSQDNIVHEFDGVTDFTRDAQRGSARVPVSLVFKKQDGDSQEVKITRAPIEYGTTVDSSWFSRVVHGGSQTETPLLGIDHANDIIFTNSSLGDDYYLPGVSIGLYADERDSYFPDKVFAAVGRYLLFRVNAPSSRVRLKLDLTTTLLRDGQEKLPPATAMGDSVVEVGLVGHGSGRVLSPPFAPLMSDGVAYVLLDLGADPKFLDTPRTGLMRIYGTKVAIDYRHLVAFARQIRLVDADTATDEAAPSRVSTLPPDLGNPNLQYSGLYEDGWMGDDGFLLLHSDKPGVAVLRGEVPGGIGLDAVDLEMRVNGAGPIHKSLTPGPFALEAPTVAGASRIAFHFSKIGRLGPGDERPVSGRFLSAAIESGTAAAPAKAAPEPGATLPAVLQGLGSHFDGVYQDGWMAPNGFVEVRADRDSDVVLGGMVPGGIGLDGQSIAIRGGQDESVGQSLPAGDFRIVVPVKAGTTNLAFSFAEHATLPGSDGRSVGALLKAITVEPQP